MPTSDTSEKGLESLIGAALTSGPGYVEGDPADYDRDHAVDLAKLLAFLQATQPEVVAQLVLDADGPKRQQFLARLQGETAKRGVVDVLRNGIKHGPAQVDPFYGTPSPGNLKAVERFAANIFSVTRQLRYSKDETQLALDLCLFINGLPVATFELKNRLTKQTVDDAVQQYKRDRDPRELLFQFGRCLVHFAVDDQEVRFCTHLKGNGSWFLPFNKGWNDGAGNPPNPSGIKTDYLWHEILTRNGLTDIIENYAQVVEEKDARTGRKKLLQIFPRYHQLDVVHKLLVDARQHGVGHRYLIEHSAGSGKSNSIAWLAHQLIALEQDSKVIFGSVIVVTDRRVLDKQIRDTIKQFAQVAATVGHAEHSEHLRKFLLAGKKIIITTVQKFPFILDAIGNEHRGRTFAILIDEAHSSQGGRAAAQMNIALSAQGGEEDEETEASINGFPSNLIPERFREDPYRFLVCADKFQTGYDEPLLHSMYVDKLLSGVKAVQTLSRLNRAHPQKHDTFVLDFMNDADTIQTAFEPYYRTTILSDETDPNKLHDLKADLDGAQVYTQTQVDQLVERYLSGADRDQLDPILDACVATYAEELDEDGQVNFKANAKTFVRTYGFLASILPYTNAPWEKLALFLNFLIPKLPAPKEEDLSRGILEAIDMESYRVEVHSAMDIALADQDAEIAPVPTSGGGRMPEPEIERLSNILKIFNDLFGNIDWKDADKIRQVITEEIPAKVAADKAYQNAMQHSDKQNARIEHDKALQRVLVELLADHTELFKQFSDNLDFKKWLTDTIFSATYTAPDA
jgi:type I site-specific restriction-modification system R (restriction) subunit